MRSLWIGVAGFFGAVARYEVEGWVSRTIRGSFPWGTMVVNLSGSFLVGFLFTVLAGRFLPHPTVRSALTIGFVGAYTTFSTLAFETLRLGEDSAVLLAVVNMVGSVVAGVCAVWLGMAAGRAL